MELPYRRFLEDLPCLVFVSQEPVGNIFVNARFCSYTGLTEDELSGHRWLKALHPSDLKVFRPNSGDDANDGGAFEAEYRLRTADGAWRWQLARGVPLDAGPGQPPYFLGAITDIHDQKMAQFAAAERELVLRLAQDAAGVGMFDWDLLTDELRWDGVCKRVFGLAPDDPVTIERFYELLHPDDRSWVGQVIARALDPDTPDDGYSVAYRAVLPSGSVRWIDARGRVMFEPTEVGRRAFRFLGAAVDVTESRETQRDLADALAARDLLLTEVNHRIKNSLQIVAALISLSAGRLSEGEGKRALTQAQNRIAVIAAIHERLYQTGRHGELDFGPFARELLSDALRSSGVEPDAVLEFTAHGDLTLEMARAVPLAIVLNELATNAVKYAWESGGERLRVAIERHERAMVLTLSDDGAGLPDGFQIGKSAGFGLRVANALVKQLGGRIEPTSGAQGATFRITVPLG
ncbi:MAG: PAS domain-containing protein [Sphingomonadaceae bacterium]|nr:PAS domain-containing protein [Sphingomonadaceae bacterium]